MAPAVAPDQSAGLYTHAAAQPNTRQQPHRQGLAWHPTVVFFMFSQAPGRVCKLMLGDSVGLAARSGYLCGWWHSIPALNRALRCLSQVAHDAPTPAGIFLIFGGSCRHGCLKMDAAEVGSCDSA